MSPWNGKAPTGPHRPLATIGSLMTRCSNNRSSALAGLCLLLMSFAPGARALDAVVLEVREISVAGVTVHDGSARLDLLGDERTRLTLKAGEALLPDPAGRFADVQLLCPQPV